MSEEEVKTEVEAAMEAPAQEGPAAESVAPAPVDAKAEDLGNEHHYIVGEELEVKGLAYVVKEVKGVDLVLARKDFK